MYSMYVCMYIIMYVRMYVCSVVWEKFAVKIFPLMM